MDLAERERNKEFTLHKEYTYHKFIVTTGIRCCQQRREEKEGEHLGLAKHLVLDECVSLWYTITSCACLLFVCFFSV